MTDYDDGFYAAEIGRTFRFQQLEGVRLPGMTGPGVTISTLTDERSKYVFGLTVEVNPTFETALCDTLSIAMVDKARFSEVAGANEHWKGCVPDFVLIDSGYEGHGVEILEKLSDVHVVMLSPLPSEPCVPSLPDWLAEKLERYLVDRQDGLETSDLRDARAHLIRTIRDVYHRQPHPGLGGKTPIEVLDIHLAENSLKLPPNDHERIVALGRDGSGTVSEDGVEFAGLLFNSGKLQMALEEDVERVHFKYSPFEFDAIHFEYEGLWHVADRVGML